jgi:hypothetical protein
MPTKECVGVRVRLQSGEGAAGQFCVAWETGISIAVDYWLKDPGTIPGSARWLSLLHIVQTYSGTHPSSYPVGTGGLSAGLKQQGHEADHQLLPRSRKVELYVYSPTFLHGIVLKLIKHWDNFTFSFTIHCSPAKTCPSLASALSSGRLERALADRLVREKRLRVFESGVLRTFGPKGSEILGG